MTAAIMQAVRLSGRHPWLVVLGFLAVTLLSGLYVARNFAIDTDSEKLLSAALPYRQQEIALERAFPQRSGQLLAVVTASTPEKAEEAAEALVRTLAPRSDVIRSIHRPDGGPFFARSGLLFLDVDHVRRSMSALTTAQPLLEVLAADPTLRGILDVLSQGLQGVSADMVKLQELAAPISAIADALERLSQGKDAAFSWRRLISGEAPSTAELRRFVNIQPVLDFDNLEPGGKATRVIRDAIAELNLVPAHGVTVRLTGPVALSDEEFGTIAEGAEINTIATVAIVLLILWLALRQRAVIAAVMVNLAVGLVLTAAVGLWLVGALNLISIAFAVLFIGIGVDFGIQFGVRYRAERHEKADMHAALQMTARALAGPLLLAAASIAAAFYSFLPTAYRGLSELGLIAGTGMIIAFVTTVTLLPALIVLLRPSGVAAEVGFPALAPVDRFLNKRGNWVVGVTIGLTLLALPLLWALRFDSNPLNLRAQNTEAVSTLLDLLRDPQTSPNTINVLADNVPDALAIAGKVRALPEVARVVTLESFIPEHQDEKLPIIAETRTALKNVIDPGPASAPPTPQETEAALATTASELAEAASHSAEPTAAQAKRLGGLLATLAKGSPEARRAAEAALVVPLKTTLTQIRDLLSADRVDLASLPQSLRSDWVAADGRARVEVAPSGDANDGVVLRRFADAVRAVAPNASGMPIGITEAAATIVKAFLQAGALSVIAITVILYFALRRWLDVALTLVPLLLALVVTLEICAAIDLKLNFANIIALPLLLGVGVAFKIYYVMAWRSGETNFLQSSLTRAVFFSACTTATAFGSLWLSHHPGTSSMGKLMALALVTTLAAATLFQPALLASQNGGSDAADDGPPPEGRGPAA
ncbi:MMPL family transporter [Chelatococcus reniformis]|uniref:RND transporter n=1 Tax=Chelatococcus reniformis TaxID=1494448 RepID=A0A916XCQ6_9HYPH|nr:MMPL family transporter [Chelatococcus reniformis]GGC62163.1 RND transporter [Chelatococcus reniformis]